MVSFLCSRLTSTAHMWPNVMFKILFFLHTRHVSSHADANGSGIDAIGGEISGW